MEAKDWVELAGSIVVAIGTIALAVATFRLAKFTKAAVLDAEVGLKQADRHHQENLRPFCVLELWKANRNYPFGISFAAHSARINGLESEGEKPEILLLGKLHNKGLGPAKDVVAYLNQGSSLEGGGCWLTYPVVVCGIIAAGATIDINVEITKYNVAIKVAGGGWPSLQVMETVSNDAYEVVLRYRDTFDNWFRTIHPKGFVQDIAAEVAIATGNHELYARYCTRPNTPMPVFLGGQQTWRTLADMQESSST